MDTHRIKVKIGDAEFDAEGNPDVVQAQFQAWMAAVMAAPKAVEKAAETPAESPPAGSGAINGNSTLPDPAGLPRAILDRVFRQGDNLSLAALPRGDNADRDAMLALLYGYLKLDNQPTVTGTLLMRSAKISGVGINRVDRIMNSMADFVLAAGVKKARRYQLNNRGLAKAEEVIKAILQ